MQLCPEIFKMPLEDISNNRLPRSSALFFLKSPPKVELQSGLSLVLLGEYGLNVCVWHLWKHNTLLMKDCLFQIDRCSKNLFEALMGSSFIFTKLIWKISDFILGRTRCDCVAADVALCTSTRRTVGSGCCLVVPHRVYGLRGPSGRSGSFVSASWMWHYLRSSASSQLIRWQWGGCRSSQLLPASQPFACTH